MRKCLSLIADCLIACFSDPQGCLHPGCCLLQEYHHRIISPCPLQDFGCLCQTLLRLIMLERFPAPVKMLGQHMLVQLLTLNLYRHQNYGWKRRQLKERWAALDIHVCKNDYVMCGNSKRFMVLDEN